MNFKNEVGLIVLKLQKIFTQTTEQIPPGTTHRLMRDDKPIYSFNGIAFTTCKKT